MAVTEGTARSTAIIGIIELVLALIAIICGGVAMSKMTSPAGVTIGIWALYYAVPGILSIFAGYSKNTSIVGVALGANIIGIILAGVGLVLGSILWAIFNSNCGGINFYTASVCYCSYNSDIYTYEASCSDLKVVRNANAMVTIANLILLIICLTGSIFGCIGTCCAPREPTVLIAGTVPAQPSTIVVSNQNTAYSQQAYPVQHQYNMVQQGYPAPVPQQAYPGGAQQGYPAPVPQQAYPGSSQQGYPAMSPPSYDGQYNPSVQLESKTPVG